MDCFYLLPSTYEIFSWMYLPSHPRWSRWQMKPLTLGFPKRCDEEFLLGNPHMPHSDFKIWVRPHLSPESCSWKSEFHPTNNSDSNGKSPTFNGRYIFKWLFFHCLPLLFSGVISCKVAWKHFEGSYCLEEWQIIPGWLKGFVLLTQSVIIDSKRTPWKLHKELTFSKNTTSYYYYYYY